MKALLAKSKTLQVFQAELLGSAIDDGVTKDITAHVRKVYCRAARSAATNFLRLLMILEFPNISALIM